MFSDHVTKQLSPYCNDELSTEESSRVAEHLIACHRCRAEFEEISLGVQLAKHLPMLSAPENLWRGIEAASNQGSAPARSSFRQSIWLPRLELAAAALVLMITVAGLWFYDRQSRPYWQVALLAGAPRVGRTSISQRGKLAQGELLQTDDASRASIAVGNIGEVE